MCPFEWWHSQPWKEKTADIANVGYRSSVEVARASAANVTPALGRGPSKPTSVVRAQFYRKLRRPLGCAGPPNAVATFWSLAVFGTPYTIVSPTTRA